MSSIKRYQKVTDAHTRYEIIPPMEGAAIELCELDGWTYISVEGALPEQHAQITVEDVTLTDELRSAIKAASPQVKAINRLCQQRIAERYSYADEIQALRLGGAEEQTWRDYVQTCVDEASVRKAALGL